MKIAFSTTNNILLDVVWFAILINLESVLCVCQVVFLPIKAVNNMGMCVTIYGLPSLLNMQSLILSTLC
jgi:hypothetical protein